ncbi:Tungstate ABC transporter, substrate-binding protein [Olavius algarvensis Delta 1 endosymbiont]|nr:Tungstate ABC transporter, substrate-binding protein [Olavius algarvensis Delta 1 endosymbiont]
MKRLFVAVVHLALIICFLPARSGAADQMLMMATTTSTDNTGLLDYLAPQFQAATGIELRWTATGTGKALKLGQNCDVDILMVHAPPAEKKFVANGFGVDRREVMNNDFVIVGPAADGAGIKGKSIEEALTAIQTHQAVFVSRGDNSGTHKKELALWKAAELPVPEKEGWYVQTGQGMLASINIAAERHGYTMTDRGTYIKYESNLKGNPPLKVLVEGDAVLLNQYSVIAINPKLCAKASYSTAKQFIQWIAGPQAQQLIKDFKLLGKPLFTPNADK